MGDIGRLARGIDHQKQVIAAIGDHQVVQNAARVIGEHGVALPPFGQPRHIDRHQPFQRQRRIRPAQDDLPHMADIEQARGVRVWVCSPITPIGYCTGMS